MMAEVRLERDSLGPVEVPAGALWGAHTQRAIENFQVSGTNIGQHRNLIRAIGTVKQSAAAANAELGLLDRDIAEAIIAAAGEVAAGEHDDQFPVDVVQGGAGTSTNMNANEVIANVALRQLDLEPGRYDVVHPIDHVNKCQSTNDVYPTSLRLALVFELGEMVAELSNLADAFGERGTAFAEVPKVGRTQLQDAVPMTLGQEFTAFGVAIREDCARLAETVPLLLELNLGATAIGTGITADPRYQRAVLTHLAAATGLPVLAASDLMEATWDTGAFMQVSGVLKRTAIKLAKVSNDLRLLSSGPQTGFAEIHLPPRQAGSSIMPGKVNPVIPEMMNQVVFTVAGADLTVMLAAENGQLQLNAFEPSIAHALLLSLQWMRNGARVLRELCVVGITANEDLLRGRARTSIAAATELVPVIGYQAAADLAKLALATGMPVIELAIERGLLPLPQLTETG